MKADYKVCLYCQSKMISELNECKNCGMPLPTNNATKNRSAKQRFIWLFIGIVIFCLFFMYYLPRNI